jgi:aryl-alcohol dehydrogenase-like predicted oxidoreductase
MMKKIALGKSGLIVPAVGLGCMGMSDFYGASEEKANLKVLDAALELGCNFWDTADMYGPFRNEELLARALKNRREQVILATKFGVKRNRAGEWLGVDGSPAYVKACCEASLQRLGTEVIDVYYQHRVDPEVPIEETIAAMAELVREGKVKYLGLSEADAETIERANKVHPISVLQTEYSLWSRDIESDILPTARRLGIGLVAYSPLGRGFLTGEISKRGDLADGDWRLDTPRFQQQAIEHNSHLVEGMSSIAAEKAISTAQLALAWVMAQGDDIATIPGTRREQYLKQNWQAMDIGLTALELEQLNKLSLQYPTQGERY